MKYKWTILASALLVFSLIFVGVVYAFGVDNVDGLWEWVEDGPNESAICDTWASVNNGEGKVDVPVDAIGAYDGVSNLYPMQTDQTLNRLSTVCGGHEGDTTFSEWTRDTSFSNNGLGSYTGCTTASTLIFSQYGYDRRNGDDYIYIEIYNGTGAAVDLSQYSLRLYTNHYTYTTIPLNATSLSNGGVYVLVNTAYAGSITQADQIFGNSDSYRTVILVKEGDIHTVTARSGTTPSIQTSPDTDENQVRYGYLPNTSTCPNTDDGFLSQSGFGFDGVNTISSVSTDVPFYLGTFTHYNNPISATGENFDWVDLAVRVPIVCEDQTETSITIYPRFTLDETTAVAIEDCPYDGPNTQGCADQVLLSQPPNTTFTCGGVDYTVNILGFTTNDDCQTVYDQSASAAEFLTRESFNNQACLWAEIDMPNADARISKACTDTEAGDYYTVSVVNTGPGTALGAKIIDTLPSSATNISWQSNLTIDGTTTQKGTCSLNTTTNVLTCDLNAALPENTVTDPTARWEVRINVELYGDDLTNTAILTTTSNDTNTANNSAQATCSPTSVSLLSFEGTYTGQAVDLTWETANETENIGFNIWRSLEPAGPKVKLNTEIIPSLVPPGSPFGALYTYSDEMGVVDEQQDIQKLDPVLPQDIQKLLPIQPKDGYFKIATNYYYWLEAVQFDGSAKFYGSVEVLVGLKE